MVGDKLRLWLDLVEKVMNVELGESNDNFFWNLNKNVVVIVKSMYSDMMIFENVPAKCVSWKLKIPLKIKVFLQYLRKWVILTKDNLVKRNWIGCTKCCFCNSNETIQHLLFDCHAARFISNAVYILFRSRY